jgi:hypothetical protein
VQRLLLAPGPLTVISAVAVKLVGLDFAVTLNDLPMITAVSGRTSYLNLTSDSMLGLEFSFRPEADVVAEPSKGCFRLTRVSRPSELLTPDPTLEPELDCQQCGDDFDDCGTRNRPGAAN